MLKDLIGSRTKQVLLSTFFGNPEKDYYTRQLAAMHNMSVGTLHREIKKLEACGILRSHEVGHIKLFSLNKQHPLFEELKSIFYKTEGAIRLAQDAVSKLSGVRVAFVYGSFAKGDEGPQSDVDIFLVGDNIPEEELVINISDLEKKLTREVNYTLYTEDEFRKKKKEKNSFLLEVLKGKKIFIRGDDRGL